MIPVISPIDCGGPLIDLEGNTIGFNISRAGRTESYAVPTSAILPLLYDLMSGNLAPDVEEPEQTGTAMEPPLGVPPCPSSPDRSGSGRLISPSGALPVWIHLAKLSPAWTYVEVRRSEGQGWLTISNSIGGINSSATTGGG